MLDCILANEYSRVCFPKAGACCLYHQDSPQKYNQALYIEKIVFAWIYLVFVSCDVCIIGNIFAECALFGLDVDESHRHSRYVFDVTFAVCGDTDYGIFGDIKCFDINL